MMRRTAFGDATNSRFESRVDATINILNPIDLRPDRGELEGLCTATLPPSLLEGPDMR
jgi:hypothetical protein